MTTLPFEKSIKKLEFFFKVTGVNIKKTDKIFQSRFRSTLFFIFNIIWLDTDVLGAIVWTINGIIDGKNITELTYDGPCIIFSFLANFKAIALVLYEGKASKLIKKLKCMEKKELTRIKKKDREAIKENAMKLLNIVVNVLNILNWILLVAFALNPLILMGRKYLNTKELECLLPFLIEYPFNPYDIKVWPIIYIKQIWSEVIAIFSVCTADFLFYIFCAHLTIQFELLQYDFEGIFTHTDNFKGVIHYDEKFCEKFIELVKWHQYLIESTKLLEVVYTKSTLFHFVSSSVIICLTGFNVMAVTNIGLIITFLSFLFMGLLQIFFLCFFGDKLMQASMNVSNAVYNSKWYLADGNLRKHLLFVLIRGQRPCKLTASGFADVSLKAFMKILSTSWSYFALLQTMYN